LASRFDLRRALLSASCAFILGGSAAVVGALAGHASPYESLASESSGQTFSSADARAVSDVLEGAKLGEGARIRAAMQTIQDPLARKIALWALIETDATGLSYLDVESARRDLAGWPGESRRLAAAERVIESGGLSPKAVIAWFNGAEPRTPEGAMALASAYQASGKPAEAKAVIRRIWRSQPFDAALQQTMLTRFGALLDADDHAAREDMLLYGNQGDAARALIPMLSPDQQALAQARMAVRSGSYDANSLISALPAQLRNAPGLAFELAAQAARRGDTATALALIPSLPAPIRNEEAEARIWKLRKELVVAALKAGDARAAYRAAADSGVAAGQNGAEAEFYAGWLALSRLKDPKLADAHFALLQTIGVSPITASRALYWRGRAAEASADAVDAQIFYAEAAKYQTAFYGQLAAAKIGQTEISLGKDPEITSAERARFDASDPVRAARLMAQIGAKDTFKRFTLELVDGVRSASQAALLVDFARDYGDQDLAMRVVRRAAQHGFVLPERGYPLHQPPGLSSSAETAFVMGIAREESGFDAHDRSPAGAVGVMQLMPSTAHALARKLGYSFEIGRLEDADYNMTLGAAYLGQLVDQFGGSYVMAAAAYNAGPGRPTEWTSFCGDPRSNSEDPADYIECIPFSETRNYVMRVLEATEVYRARLGGGRARLSLATDLKRGGYAVSPPSSSPTLTSASFGSPGTP
jgi:soluble lytic murein transglycosylase